MAAGFPKGTAVEIAAAMGVTFGAAGWLALWLHVTMVEIYVSLTPDAPPTGNGLLC